MPSLKPNLVKRIEHLPKPARTSDALQPLFEAISNSIHSTQNKFGNQVSKQGKVVVSITTGQKQAPVSISVEDNGIGLDKVNFDAFMTTDTDNKEEIGGKGIGRLLWLDCFETIKVTSVYRDGDTFRRRRFNFVLSFEEQLQDYSDEVPEPAPTDSMFFVKFDGLRDNGYKDKFPRRGAYVFQHMTSHFLPIFIGGRSPQITVHCGDETRHYPDAINSIVHRTETLKLIETEGFGRLTLTLTECDKVASADLKGLHFVHFVAHERTVHSQKIDSKLGLKHFGENEDRVFHAILIGEYLDKNVDQQRTRFLFDDAVFERIINDVCTKHIGST